MKFKKKTKPKSKPASFAIASISSLQRWQQVITAYNESLWTFKSYISKGYAIPDWVFPLDPEALGDLYDEQFAGLGSSTKARYSKEVARRSRERKSKIFIKLGKTQN